MAISEHQKIQQELKQPDPFFEAIGEAREYYQKNRTQVVAVGAGAVLTLFTVIGGSSWYVTQGTRAATDFSLAVSNLEFDSPSAAEAALRSLESRTNAGPYQALADLYSGDIAAEAGRLDEAVTEYDAFLASAPTDYLRQIGLMGKAAALEKNGKAAEAAASLDLAAAIDGPYRSAALSDRARLAEEAGDKEVAASNLKKLLELEGSGASAASIERRLQALQ